MSGTASSEVQASMATSLRTGAPLSVLAVPIAILATACSSSSRSSTGIRIFDPAGRVHQEVRSGDIASATVIRGSGRTRSVALVFTKPGVQRFDELTRLVAERGVREHRNQHFAVAVDGHVYARPYL